MSGGTSVTKFLVFLLVAKIYFSSISPACRSREGFCVEMIFSAFSVVRACGMLYIISLRFLRFCMFASRWSPHFSRIWEIRISISSLVSASSRTFPFLRLLSDLIPTGMLTGSVCAFSSCFISSVVWCCFSFRVSLCRSSFLRPLFQSIVNSSSRR